MQKAENRPTQHNRCEIGVASYATRFAFIRSGSASVKSLAFRDDRLAALREGVSEWQKEISVQKDAALGLPCMTFTQKGEGVKK